MKFDFYSGFDCTSLIKSLLRRALLDQWEEYAKQKVEKEISEEEIQSLRIPGSKLQENSLSFVKYKKSN